MTKGKYITYKQSGVSWLGEIPEHWEIRRIKYVFKELDRRSETGKEDLLSVSQYTGVTKKSDKVAKGESISNAKTLEGYKIVGKGDLVINIMLAWNGSLGISKYNGIVSPAYCVYRNLQGNVNYFGYLFKTKNAQQEFKKQSTGIIDSRLRMYTDSFFDIKTALPPIEEQTTIANFLDYKTEKINRFIKKKKQLIKLLKEQKAVIINKAVTKGLEPNAPMKDSDIEWLGEIPEHWEMKRLKGVAKIKGRIGFRGYTTDDLVDKGNGAITIGATHIKNGAIDLSKAVYLSWEKYFQSPEIVVNQNDILVVQRGSCGVIGYVQKDFGEMTINPSIVLVKEIKIYPKFLFYSLNSSLVQNEIHSTLTNTAIPMLSQSQIRNFKIITPSLQEQILIVNYIELETDKINKTISTIEREITLVEEYKIALIAEAVTGKIDARGFKVPSEDTPLEKIAEETANYNKR